MRIISSIFYWIGTRFSILHTWFETHDFPPPKITGFFYRMGRKIYPDGYCRGCGILVDPRIREFYWDTGWAFNGMIDKKYERPFCSNCCKSPTAKQLEIYRAWRKKHPIKESE